SIALHYRLLVRFSLLTPSRLVSSLLTATATPEIYTLSLHDALPISRDRHAGAPAASGTDGLRADCPWSGRKPPAAVRAAGGFRPDRKSTRLNSSHVKISYAVFCLKKKKNKKTNDAQNTP